MPGRQREVIVSIMPIYATCRDDEGSVKRYFHGFMIRGPQHARESSDRVNILVVEGLRPSD